MTLHTARATLRTIFGYDSFRSGQEEIIAAVLAGKDVFAVMPTGSGKSLTYQLPATMTPGLTVVVSPLIALMRDQVRQLQRLGVAAATLNSTSSADEADAAGELLRRGELRLLFVSPERLAMPGFLARLRTLGVSRLAIDEAHCISQWGHDFRPEYRMLAHVREELGNVPVLALTATADAATRADILAQLFPQPPLVVVHSFDRPNLELRFEAKDRPRTQIGDFLDRHRGESGIVYVSSRDRTEKLAEHFAAKGHRALPYHAGLEQRVRSRNQDAFQQEDGVVMMATIAFGMGINKPDVRFVVHADMPGSIESYYQEIGRAGRDGLPAATLTLYGTEDIAFRRRQIAEKGLAPGQLRTEQKRLRAMIDLCEAALCRRQALLAYFGEKAGPCGQCDLCRGGARRYDATVDAQKILSAAVRTGQRFGAGHLADILVGNASDSIRRLGHDRLKTFGVGQDRPRHEWLGLVRQLYAAGLLEEASVEHGGFCLTEQGEAVLRGQQSLELRTLPERQPRTRRRTESDTRIGDLDAAGNALFTRLRETRLALARAEGVAAFMIFPDRTLIEIARIRPRNRDDLRAIHGVGEAKLDRYGDIFLAAVAAHEAA